MTQPVPVVLGGLDEVGVEQLPQPGDHVHVRCRRTAVSSGSVSGRAATASTAATSVAAALDGPDPTEQHLRHPWRDPGRHLQRRRDVVGGRHELLGEEGVALAAAEHVGHERRGRLGVDERRDQRPDVVIRQRSESDSARRPARGRSMRASRGRGRPPGARRGGW